MPTTSTVDGHEVEQDCTGRITKIDGDEVLEGPCADKATLMGLLGLAIFRSRRARSGDYVELEGRWYAVEKVS